MEKRGRLINRGGFPVANIQSTSQDVCTSVEALGCTVTKLIHIRAIKYPSPHLSYRKPAFKMLQDTKKIAKQPKTSFEMWLLRSLSFASETLPVDKRATQPHESAFEVT